MKKLLFGFTMMSTVSVLLAQNAAPAATSTAGTPVATTAPVPARAPIKPDGGSELALKAQQEQATVKPETASSARDLVEKRLAKKKIHQGFDTKKSRLVVIATAEDQCLDPSKDKSGKWLLIRLMLAKKAVLSAKVDIAQLLSSTMSAADRKEFLDLSPEELSQKPTSSFSSTIELLSRHPIQGATVICQTESYIDGIYQVAVAVAWSRALQESALRTLQGDTNPKDLLPGKGTVQDWIDQQDLSMMVGPRQFIDEKGFRHFIGIAAMGFGKNMLLKERNINVAKLNAKATVMFSLLSDFASAEASKTVYNQYLQNPNDYDSATTNTIVNSLSQQVSQTIENQEVQGLVPLKEVETVHPLFGQKMYVAVYEMSPEVVKQARELSLISNWIRAESARENQYQRGLRESQEASIEAAKNDQDAYNKGAQAGSQAMADESARRQQKTEKKGIIIEAPAAVQPQQQQPRHQVKQGVISGDKDINDDF